MNGARNVWAIVRKEWTHYFGSPIAYVALFVWMLLFGIFYFFALSFFLQQSMRMGAEMGGLGAPKLSINEYLIRPVFHNMAVVVLFIAPMLTMRLFAEEKRQGTIELLATSPITQAQVVLGKFLAALGLYGLMIVAGVVNFLVIWRYAANPPEWKPVLTGMLALLLFGACFLAVGLFISTLTDNQIVAGVLSFAAFLALWVLGWADEPGTGAAIARVALLVIAAVLTFVVTRNPIAAVAAGVLVGVIAFSVGAGSETLLADLIKNMAVTDRMEDLVKGVVDLKDLVFYLSFITFGLFLGHQSLETQRWRA